MTCDVFLCSSVPCDVLHNTCTLQPRPFFINPSHHARHHRRHHSTIPHTFAFASVRFRCCLITHATPASSWAREGKCLGGLSADGMKAFSVLNIRGISTGTQSIIRTGILLMSSAIFSLSRRSPPLLFCSGSNPPTHTRVCDVVCTNQASAGRSLCW